jgi:hypothetical protein
VEIDAAVVLVLLGVKAMMVSSWVERLASHTDLVCFGGGLHEYQVRAPAVAVVSKEAIDMSALKAHRNGEDAGRLLKESPAADGHIRWADETLRNACTDS